MTPESGDGLYDRPVLAIEPGTHTGRIYEIDADAGGQFLVTASSDKTVRLWSAEDGKLLSTIRLPSGPGPVGEARAVAISPDGGRIASGGWSYLGGGVYLFDRASGRILTRTAKLPGVVNHIAFARDGQRLAVMLGSGHGLRVLDSTTLALQREDLDYRDGSYGAAFAGDGCLATTSNDGHLRLYAPDLKRLVSIAAPGGMMPYAIAWAPSGERLAVGYIDTARVDVLDGTTLKLLFRADIQGVDHGNLGSVAWSADGAFLFATGTWSPRNRCRLRRWTLRGRGAFQDFPLGTDTVMTLKPLPKGKLAFAGAGPTLGVLRRDGRKLWQCTSALVDFRQQERVLAVSTNGEKVTFRYKLKDKRPAVFDLHSRLVTPGLTWSAPTKVRTGRLRTNWAASYTNPAFVSWPLLPYERPTSLAVAPDNSCSLFGTEWALRLLDRDCELLWIRHVPAAVWAVTMTLDIRLAVAAYGDGTIRWHRMSDGEELLAFLPLADRTNWVAWTPEGLYACTPPARSVLRWHVNHGWDQPAEAIPVHEIAEQHRPEVLRLVLQELDEVRALGLVERKKIRNAVRRRTGGDPAGRLHLLAIGVSTYREEYAKHLRLHFADADARDVVSALRDSQETLYADVAVQVLQNELATRRSILRGLETIRQAMQQAPGRDLAVVQFSGHGAVVDNKLYLLPHEVDPRTAVELKDTALSFDQLRDEFLGIAQHGRVLVLLDACRSGTATMDGARITLDPIAARAALAAPNVTVLTSSAPADPSFEDARWANGAFIEAFLDALRSHADRDNDGLVTIGDIEWHVARRLPDLTGGRQHLGIEKRFDGSIFVVGL